MEGNDSQVLFDGMYADLKKVYDLRHIYRFQELMPSTDFEHISYFEIF